jgi:hypothetical protein
MERINATLHENLSIIEVSEGLLLDTLLADAHIAPCILTRLSERAAIVAPGNLNTLLARLRRLGHTPGVLAE